MAARYARALMGDPDCTRMAEVAIHADAHAADADADLDADDTTDVDDAFDDRLDDANDGDADDGDEYDDSELTLSGESAAPQCPGKPVRPAPAAIDPRSFEEPSLRSLDHEDLHGARDELDPDADPDAIGEPATDLGDAADRTGDGYIADGWSEDLLVAQAPIDGGIGFASTAFVDSELYDAGARHQRPSRWGRLDLSLAWRQTKTVSRTSTRQGTELWLLATWRR